MIFIKELVTSHLFLLQKSAQRHYKLPDLDCEACDKRQGHERKTRDPGEKKRSYQGQAEEEEGPYCEETRKQEGQCENVQISREGIKIPSTPPFPIGPGIALFPSPSFSTSGRRHG